MPICSRAWPRRVIPVSLLPQTFAALALAACISGAQQPESSFNEASPAGETEHPIPAEEPRVIWTASGTETVARHHSAMAGENMDVLDIRALRADASWLYIDVKLIAANKNVLNEGGPAELYALRDDCQLGSRRVSGTVWRNEERASTLVTSLSELPDGDLSMTLRAHGVNAGFSLRKSGKSIRRLTAADRPGYRVYPADTKSGLPARFVIEGTSGCNAEEAP